MMCVLVLPLVDCSGGCASERQAVQHCGLPQASTAGAGERSQQLRQRLHAAGLRAGWRPAAVHKLPGVSALHNMRRRGNKFEVF
jgi:hypothetical protein